MATADPALLDARVRAAEKTLAAHYGRTLIEHRVTLAEHRSPLVELVETGSARVSTSSTGGAATNGATSVRVVEYPATSAADTDLPPIILLHGIASVSAVAMPLVGALPSRRVLAVDWPGHGLSGLAVLPRDLDLRVFTLAVLDAIIASFEVEQVDIVGHSLGGQLALRRRARVRRLVLLGAPGAGFGEARPALAMRMLAVPGLGTGILGLSTSESSYRRQSEGLLGAGALTGFPAEIVEIGYLASQRSDFAPSVSSLFRTLMTPFGIRPLISLSLDELASIVVPTLMVWGDDDLVLDPEAGRASFDALPDAELLSLPGGHAPWLNDLGRVGAAVSAFLTAPSGPTE